MSEAATTDAGHAGVLATLRGSPPAVRFLLLGVLVNRLGSFLQVFLVLYLVHRGFTEGQAGLALGAHGAGAVLGVLAGGGLADRLGPRTTIVISMAATAVLTVAVLFLPAFGLIVVVVALVGAVGQAYRPASFALLSELVPASRQVMIAAAFRLALNIGTVAAPLIALALIKISWILLFWCEGLAAGGYALIAVALLPKPAAPPPAGAGPAPRLTYLTVARDRRYLLYLFAMLANALIYVQYLAVLPLDIRDSGYPTALYAGLISLNAGFVIGCELIVTSVVQRLPVRLVVTVGLALLGAGLSMYALPGGVAMLVAATLVWSLAEVIGGPTMFAYPATVAPAAAKGRYIGAAHAMFGVGGAIGPVAGVLLWEHVHEGVWLVCGAVSVLAVLAANAGMRQPRTAPAAPEALAGGDMPGEGIKPDRPEPVALGEPAKS